MERDEFEDLPGYEVNAVLGQGAYGVVRKVPATVHSSPQYERSVSLPSSRVHRTLWSGVIPAFRFL